MMKLLLATHNRDKQEELRAMLQEIPVEVVTLDAFPTLFPPLEDSPTLEGNALKKARAAYAGSKIPSIADDTGLEVSYLNGAPGVLTSRFAGPGASYSDNVAKLLREMRGVPQRRRGAQFRTAIALVGPGFEHVVEGVCRGSIVEKPLGTQGFGYDPIFRPDGFTLTFAQMNPTQKNGISHRGRALGALKEDLGRFIR